MLLWHVGRHLGFAMQTSHVQMLWRDCLPSFHVRCRLALLCLLQSMTTAAGLLVSKDSGATWKVVGDIEVRRADAITAAA